DMKRTTTTTQVHFSFEPSGMFNVPSFYFTGFKLKKKKKEKKKKKKGKSTCFYFILFLVKKINLYQFQVQ
ncbi:MAG: hypothetical protein N6V41_00880, partial [Candidatus Portiera aleyrodidarum]|nr:hypothetical protein [Candidatus Portiera aleyrodidarum]